MEQKSYMFRCRNCGCGDLYICYRTEAIRAYTVTKLVEGDVRRDKSSGTNLSLGRESFCGYRCQGCGQMFCDINDLKVNHSVVDFEN